MKKKLPVLLLFAIIIIGLFLRLYNINLADISYDEAVTITLSKKPLFKPLIEANLKYDAHPPLYFLLMHFWPDSSSLWPFRLMSVIFSTITILMVFLIANEIFDEKTALASALLVSLSSLHIEMAQFIRFYSFFACLISISFYFLLKAIKGDKGIFWVIYSIMTILCFYADPYTLFYFIAASMIIFFWKDKGILKKGIICHSAIFIVSIPSFIMLYIKAANNIVYLSPVSSFWHILIIPYNFFVFTLGNFSPYMGEGYSLNMNYIILLAFILIVYAYLFVKGVLTSRKKDNLLLLVTLFIPIILLYLITVKYYIPLAPKRFIFIIFVYYILISKGLCSISNKKIFSLLLLLIIAVNMVSLVYYYDGQITENPNWSSVAGFISSNSKGGDVIGASSNTAVVPFKYYYDGSLPIYGIPKDYDILSSDISIEPIKKFDKFINQTNFLPVVEGKILGHSRLWLISNRAETFDKEGILPSYLEKEHTLVYSQSFSPHTRLYLYALE
ncbi:glycosyltransferase family 39 protein [Candidatus Woesearchaeota archaeon]|nr:glycosyltransferase family 39 protein [Candidatus Woesearchaeota archaeon]